MLNEYRASVLSLRASGFLFSDKDANDTWRDFCTKISVELIAVVETLADERKDWESLTLYKLYQDALAYLEEEKNGTTTARTETVESRVDHNQGVWVDSGFNHGDRETHGGETDLSLSSGASEGRGSCEGSVVWAVRRGPHGGETVAFKCPECKSNHGEPSAIVTWRPMFEHDFEIINKNEKAIP